MSSFTALSLIGFGSVVFLSRSALARQLDEWRITPRSERFTELYFTNYRQLSAPLIPSTPQKLSFTIHNLEHQTTTYHYKLLAKSGDGAKEQVLAEGALSLVHDHSHAVTRPITIPALGERVAVRVNLEYQGIVFGKDTPSLQKQSIQYWVNANTSVDDEDQHEAN